MTKPTSSRSSSRSRRRKQSGHSHHESESRGDWAIYVGLLLVGLFVIFCWWALDPGTWRHGAVGYVIAMAFLVNLYTFRVIGGAHVARWQRALARVPLRWVGYGTEGGKPIDAAHGSDKARMALFVSIAVSVVIVVVFTVVMV